MAKHFIPPKESPDGEGVGAFLRRLRTIEFGRKALTAAAVSVSSLR
jgi:hypothetical protein